MQILLIMIDISINFTNRFEFLAKSVYADANLGQWENTNGIMHISSHQAVVAYNCLHGLTGTRLSLADELLSNGEL